MCQIILLCSLHHTTESEEPTCNVSTPLTRPKLTWHSDLKHKGVGTLQYLAEEVSGDEVAKALEEKATQV